ncbi:N-terminal kinase-like protein yata [Brevipalpus obovatus]|uniref:N-terminal kinase-like protein yata n=1 Tax=Brevipalpus obovatus TaxID=246614 RepID=UPI003D9F89F0
MWSFWNRNSIKDFPYEIGDVQPMSFDDTIWALHKGKKKGSEDDVSIFQFESKPGRENLIDNAKSALKRLKTLRHPSILTYLHSSENEKMVCIVTEPVTPLSEYLRLAESFTKEQRNNAISYGLYQVAVGIGFINNDCNCVHNNIHTGSILVNQSGIWRIAGLEYMTNYNAEDQDRKVTKHSSALSKYDPPEYSDPSRLKHSQRWSTDSYGLGCVVWEVFNGTLPDRNSLKTTSKIPADLIASYKKLLESNPKTRLSAADFVRECRAKGSYMKNTFVDSMLFLEEIQIKETGEKNRFFNHLNDRLESFPPDVSRGKIANQLTAALEFNNSGSSILGPLLKIGRLLSENDFQKKIVPCVVKLFSSKDRATRGKLLQEMESYINYVQPNVVNEQIFPHVSQGFLDSNNIIREQTVKCMLHLAPKLSYANLNEEILKHFGRLQMRDEESGIRTNTVVCLGKIARYLHPQIRQTVLIPFFLRAMRDPFPPARVAGILALSATQNFYSLRDTSSRVMPALCHLTMDPDKSVRDQAFKALKGFVSKIEKVSEDSSLAEQMEADLNVSGGNVNQTFAASWATWAVSSLTSKFYRTKPSSAPLTTPSAQTGRMDSSETIDDRPERHKMSSSNDFPTNTNDEAWSSIDDTPTSDQKSLDGWEEEQDWNSETEVEDKNDKQLGSEKEDKFISPVIEENDALFQEYEDLMRKGSPSSKPPSSISDDFLEEKQPSRPRKPIDTTRERKPKQNNKGPMKLGARKIS